MILPLFQLHAESGLIFNFKVFCGTPFEICKINGIANEDLCDECYDPGCLKNLPVLQSYLNVIRPNGILGLSLKMCITFT